MINQLKIAFRTDASLQIGTGHFMRCLTLADGLKQQDASIRFISRELPVHLRDMLAAKGMELVSLDSNASAPSADGLAHAHWLETSQAQDAQATIQGLSGLSWDWLVVDHYALDARWEATLRKTARKILVIDDIADRQHDCDLLLDQTYGRNTIDYKSLVPVHTKLLLGADYAMLRPEFAEWRDFSLKRRVNPELKQLLITMGGIDADNVTGRVLTALKDSALPNDLKITIVMGVAAPWLEQVKQQAGQMLIPTEVKVDATNMAEIMAHSDLAIGASGSTSWERCCLGLPSLMLVLADNQKKIATVLKEKGAAIVVELDNLRALESSLLTMTKDHLKRLSGSSQQIVDGLGAQRVLDNMASIK